MQSCFFDSVDMPIHYQCEGDGPVLICLHGGRGNSGDYFFPYLSPLAEELKMVYLDERGSGRSKPVPDRRRVDYDGMSADIDNLMEHLRVSEAGLLGHSWGACLALYYAVSRPGRVRELYIVAGGPTYSDLSSSWWPAFYDSQIARLGIKGPLQEVYGRYNRGKISADESYRAAVGCQLPAVIYDMEGREDEIRETFARTDYTFLGPENSDFHEPDLLAQLAEISCPTLLLAGQHDLSMPIEHFGAMAREIPDCEMCVIPRSRHFPFIDQQQLFLASVRRFRQDRGLAGGRPVAHTE